MNPEPRRFHQASWDEPIIFELSVPGERGIAIPPVKDEIAKNVGDPLARLPESILRQEPPDLPEISQHRVLQHYLRLSQETLGQHLNVDVGQGTCTMKYNPPIDERFATSSKLTELHPLQDESTVQGILEIMYKLDLFLREISGLDRFSLQPGGGSHAIYAMACMVRAYFAERGEERDEIITTLFSHPSDAAAPRVKGFRPIIIPPDPDGFPDIGALKEAVSERTAALFITNPEDTGIFNPRISEFTEIVHAAGGLCCYDQANANGLLGITRAREAGFDMSFFNLHKTFSSPHGCGGPGSGALGAAGDIADYLPVPLVGYDPDADRYFLDYDLPKSIGKVKDFYGVIPAIVRAYGWIMSLGAGGLRAAAETAVLNNNYLLHKLRAVKGMSAPFAPGRHRLEQVRYSFAELSRDTGVHTTDIQRRVADFGAHYWTSHEPWYVPEPVTIEPTESYSRRELDEYAEILRRIAEEAYSDPETVKTSPHSSTVGRVTDHSHLDDPGKWAVTWRGYRKRYNGYFEPRISPQSPDPPQE